MTLNIYTGYWNRLDRYLSHGLFPVRISGLMKWMPESYKEYPVIEYLRPSWELVQKYHADHDEEYYTKEYNKRFENITQNQILIDLIKISHQYECNDLILMCYESEGFCHRHLVAKYLNKVLKPTMQVFEYRL